ncbi:MAG: DNA polymerase III subunit chi [Methylovirgula sp.]
MEIWFYHLQTQRLERALPALLERALAQGWRVVVQAASEERLDALDDVLWTYADASFLAHGRARDGDAEMQPVYLTCGGENPNAARLRLFVDGADIAGGLAPDAAYDRAILLFDGNDPDQLDSARAQWKALKSSGFPLTYWQQTEAGGWEKKG